MREAGTGTLRVRAEVIAIPPAILGLPRSAVAFGYDARAGDAPESFKGTIRVGEAAAAKSATVHLTTKTTYNTSQVKKLRTLAVIGGLFNGSLEKRSERLGASLRYALTPKNVQASVLAPGTDLLVVRHTQSRSGDLAVIAEDQRQAMHARATLDAPKTLEVRLSDRLYHKASGRAKQLSA